MSLADRARNLAWYALDAGGAFRLARRLGRDRLTVLTYHHVLPDALRTATREDNVIYVSEFAQHVAYLASRHRIVDGTRLRAFLDGGSLPPHPVLITFDDGYANNHRHALPILRRFGAAAVFFITSRFVGDRRNRLWYDRLDSALSASPDAVSKWAAGAPLLPEGARSLAGLRLLAKRLPPAERDALVADVEAAADHYQATGMPAERCEPMTWDEVRDLAREGMEIGAHTATHQILAAAQHALGAELAECRATIESQLDRECWTFSYPNGERADFGPAEAEALRAAGFRCAFTQIPGLVGSDDDAFALSRIPVPSSPQLRIFKSRVSGLHRLLTVPLRASA
jgi:peptidoglycan/xylan/chitin deacetylase (PgdA/CDA1 family)